MTTPREAWTDPRIDDLSKKVDDGFAAADKKMETGFAKVDARFEKADEKMEARFDSLDKKVDRLMWGLVAIGTGVVPALLGIIGSLVQSHLP